MNIPWTVRVLAPLFVASSVHTQEKTTPPPHAQKPAETGINSSRPDVATQPNEQQAEEQLVVSTVIDRLQKKPPAGITPERLKETTSVIQELVNSSRADQASSAYTFVRYINQNIYTVTNCDCDDFKNQILTINTKLLERSYVGDPDQSGNPSHQIKLLMPLLIEDSLNLSGDLPDDKTRRADFKTALELLSDRFFAATGQTRTGSSEQPQESKPSRAATPTVVSTSAPQPDSGASIQGQTAPAGDGSSEQAQTSKAAGSSTKAKGGQKPLPQEQKLGASVIDGLKKNPPVGIPMGLIEEAVSTIQQITETSRADQASVYAFVRQVNRNLDALTRDNCEDGAAQGPASVHAGRQKTKKPDPGCEEFKDNVRKKTEELLAASYTDALVQNGNLSHQIKLRMPLLIEDSLNLAGNQRKDEIRRRDFKTDLSLLSDRYIGSRRFRLGIGFAYSYVPTVSYTGHATVDLTQFQPLPNANTGITGVSYGTVFSDATYPGVLLSAKVPYFRVDGIFSNLRQTRNLEPIVIATSTAIPNGSLLWRTTGTSTLRLEYDLSIKVEPLEIIHKLTGASYWVRRVELGFGGGVSGFRVEDNTSTEVKVQTNSASFNDLPPGKTQSATSSTSLRNFYWDANVSLDISDEFQVALETRLYNSKDSGDKHISVSGATLWIGGLWFPTL